MFTAATASEASKKADHRAGGRARAAQFTTEYQRRGYQALVRKYGKAGAMRILAESISKRPRTEPENRLEDILAGMGVDYATCHIVECPDAAYAVDFYLPACRLVIQVDGEYFHSLDDRHLRDLAVDRKIEQAGHEVLRFSDKAITLAPEYVHACIEAAISLLTPINGKDLF